MVTTFCVPLLHLPGKHAQPAPAHRVPTGIAAGPSFVRPSVNKPRRADDTARRRTESRSPRVGEEERAGRAAAPGAAAGYARWKENPCLRGGGGGGSRREAVVAEERAFELGSIEYHRTTPAEVVAVPARNARSRRTGALTVELIRNYLTCQAPGVAGPEFFRCNRSRGSGTARLCRCTPSGQTS